MATYKPVDAVTVHVWGHPVGYVALDPSTGFYAFEYDPKWKRRGIDLSPLKMPLSEADNGAFVFNQLSIETYQRLPALLADALPDKFGNSLITKWMAENGVMEAAVTPLDRLAYMGERSMGALTFEPARGPRISQPTAIDMEELVKAARITISGNLKDDANQALKNIIQVGTSAGGARAKATIAIQAQTKDIKTGQFSIPKGYDAWLLKFDGVGADDQLGPGKDYGRIEYVYSQMARNAGIQMMDCELLHEGGRAHFMTKRFDRDGNTRHHMQTLCGVSHLDFNQIGTNSYHQLFQTIMMMPMGDAAKQQAMHESLRRMVFNVMSANHDDHTKNFSFLLKEGGQWDVAPAYDITFSYNPDNQWIRQHLMSVNGKTENITAADILAVADRYAMTGIVGDVIEQARYALSEWKDLAAQSGIAPRTIAHIAKVHQQMDLYSPAVSIQRPENSAKSPRKPSA